VLSIGPFAPLMSELKYHFASDNCSGVCPEAWEAMAQANQGYAAAYGDDAWTRRATDLIRQLFEIECEVFFTFNGTAANSLALAHLCQSYHSVICHERSHVETDECGGPEFFSNGTKLLLVPGDEGRVEPASVEATVKRRTDIHYPKPNVLSITQATELGTVYTARQLDLLCETTRRLKLKLHMDGSRFANAIASLACSPKDITWKVGVDVLCFGGAKNGLPIAEAVVFFNKQMAYEFDYRCKQAGQLGSKMRFLAAPWVGLLESGAWLKNAQNANRCARLLEAELRSIPSLKLLSTVEANSVFVELPTSVAEGLRAKGWRFYTFIGEGGARFMCSWDTTEEQVKALAGDIKLFAR
jgi:threonine aldolase